MTRTPGAYRAGTDERTPRRPKWPWVLLALLVLVVAILIVFFALGWLSVDFTGGDIDAPSVDVDSDLPDVEVDPGEAPDIDVEDDPSN